MTPHPGDVLQGAFRMPPPHPPHPGDVVQGAFRMRGIAVGQTVTMLVIPEVYLDST